MQTLLNTPFYIGKLQLPNRLIQGPLAGFSCAPMRQLVYQFTPPAYCVSEMISALDLLKRHDALNRYTYRAAEERRLCYQISGTSAHHLTQAALRLEALGADLIDINCGCPKPKIRKKGAGSALLDNHALLIELVTQVRSAIQIPLTVKLRVQDPLNDIMLARALEQAGVDALIVHARRWHDDYTIACDWPALARIKRAVSIPVIANGDLTHHAQIAQVYQQTGCDAFMLARAGCGQPWIYQSLLSGIPLDSLITAKQRKKIFEQHVLALAALEGEHQALLQSQSLVRYYFKKTLSSEQLQQFRAIQRLSEIKKILDSYPEFDDG